MESHQNIRVGVSAVIVQNERVLLIGYDLDDGYGFHYNLPGGGVEPGESLHEALHREAREEAAADIDIGRLLFVTEYVPAHSANKYGAQQKLGLFFACTLRPGNDPRQPNAPVDRQLDVFWIALADLPNAPLLPKIGAQICRAYSENAVAENPFILDWDA